MNDANSQPAATPCPPALERALRLIGDSWTLLIAYQLGQGSKRFGELLDVLGNVSPKTVSQRLKMLETIGFVERQAFAEIPPRVIYHLTTRGQALIGIIDAAGRMGDQYFADGGSGDPLDALPAPPCAE